MSKVFPEATLTLKTVLEASKKHDFMTETFVNGECNSTTYDFQPEELKVERAHRGAPLTGADTREELKRFPVEGCNDTPEELADFLNEESQ